MAPGYLEIPQGESAIPPVPLTQFTITAIINLKEFPFHGRIVDKITAGTGDGFLLDIYPAYTFRIISNGSSIISRTQIATNTPIYVAATFRVAESSIFVNGMKTDSASLNAPPQNGFPIRVGFDSHNQNRFPGTIERARVYFSALSDVEIQRDYEEAMTSINEARYWEALQGEARIPTVPLTQFAITAVVTLKKAPWHGRIVDRISAGGVDGFLLDIWPVNTVRIISGESVLSSLVPLPYNTPTYIAATYGASQSSIFVNGVKVAFASLHEPPQNAFPIRIGFDSNNQNQFPGTIQRARVYFSALSDVQIEQDYAAAKRNLQF